MLRRHFSEPDPEWLRPSPWPSLSWWVAPMTNCMRLVIEARARQGLKRELTVISACSGVLAEGWASVALGLPVGSFVGCDSDEAANQFVKRFHGPRLAHLYSGLSCFRQKSMAGDCTVHGQYCVVSPVPTADMFLGGPPCRPYSSYRHNRNTVLPEDHPEFYTVFGNVETGEVGYLQAVGFYKPRGGDPSIFHRFCIEQNTNEQILFRIMCVVYSVLNNRSCYVTETCAVSL